MGARASASAGGRSRPCRRVRASDENARARTRPRPAMDLGRARLRRVRSNVEMTSRGNARRACRTRRWRCRSRRSPTSTRARLVRPGEVRGDAKTCHYAPVAPDAWTPRARASEARREVPRRRGAEHKKVSLLVPPGKETPRKRDFDARRDKLTEKQTLQTEKTFKMGAVDVLFGADGTPRCA